MTSRAALKSIDTKSDSVLYTSLDVGDRSWELGLTGGEGTITTKEIEAVDFEQLDEKLEWAKEYFDLDQEATVVCCHEAGRQGFWLHRKLEDKGIVSAVVDPGSLRSQKKGERAKTDRIDAEKLVDELVRWCRGHRDHSFNLVRVPEPADEDDRHLFREEEQLIEERTERTNRIESLLKTQGIDEYPPPGGEEFDQWLEDAEGARGEQLGEYLVARLRRESRRLARVDEDLEEVRSQRDDYLRGDGRAEHIEKARSLTMFRGIGQKTAFGFVVELFGWRDFENRRQIGAYLGLDPQRYDSGETERDQSITRQGNARVRRLAIQLARNWLQYQPDSELTKWARQRFVTHEGTVSNRGIVALARKLMNRLRVFLEDGVVPHGAQIGSPAF